MQRSRWFTAPRCLLLAAGLAAGLATAACQQDEFNNVAACEEWVDSVSCGDTDVSTLIDCDIYADTTQCDIADYFDCLTDNTTCDEENGIIDVSAWTSCVSLASCD